jgi:predicted alpha-1,2-mannosidase
MKNLPILLISLALMLSCTQQKQPVDYVDPYIGSISHLLQPAQPTVQLPNSMVRVYPRRDGFTGDRLYGLPVLTVTHRERQAFSISPSNDGTAYFDPSLSYDNERVTPYSYSVSLDELGVDVKYAPSHQSAVYSFDFAEGGQPVLVLDPGEGDMQWKGDAAYGWVKYGDSPLVVHARFELLQQPQKVELVKKGSTGRLVLTYPEGTRHVDLRYGISYIDEAQAKANLEREMGAEYDVEKVAAKGREIWNETLSKIKVDGDDEDMKYVFYTALYRTYERMICLEEDGRYFSPYDGKVHQAGEHKFYNDDWIWDTYRSTHPLRTIIEPEMEQDMIASYVTMASQMDNFWMPTFPEAIGDTRRMNCNHGILSVVDAYAKGLVDFDLASAYEAALKGITEKTLIPWSAAPAGELDAFYQEHGYIPALWPGQEETVPHVNRDWEKRQPVEVTLGTSYDEWGLAQVAKALGYEADYDRFMQRSLNYRKVFNHDTKFFHPKDKDGRFIEPFDYRWGTGNGTREYYGENNGWVYRWWVQHNVADLVALMGGPEEFIKELDRTFAEPLGDIKFRFWNKVPDQTGNVGQFSMGNEPCFHTPYLYSYAGAPWKTQKRVRTLLDQWFRNDLMGYCGDEDGGAMGAFAVFSALGFYPVTPGLPMYVIGSPVFENAEISLGNGKTFKIVCHNYSPENKYIESAVFNGREWNQSWFSHEDLIAGGTLEFVMSPTPNKDWAKTSVPPSFVME